MTKFEELFKGKTFKDDAERDTYKQMFDFYVSDLPENFYANQFTLASKYDGTDYEAWADFLQYPAFDTWKSKQINIIANTETDKALAGGLKDRESVNLLKARQDVLDNDNKTIKPIVIVMPMDLFFKEEK